MAFTYSPFSMNFTQLLTNIVCLNILDVYNVDSLIRGYSTFLFFKQTQNRDIHIYCTKIPYV